MAPAARKQSSGGCNTKRQITKTKIPSPSPSLPKKRIPKSNPNPSPQSPTSSPTTPSPRQPKRKKPLPVIAQAPSPSLEIGKEVVGKRIKVYSLLDKSWYEGCVKSYDEDSRKHLVQYDDVEEELLVLGKGKKIEWVEENVVKKFNQLHRASSGFRRMVIEDENMDSDSDGGDVNDESSDEDWGENVEKEVSEEEEDADLVDEEEEHDNDKERKSELRERKASGGGGKLDTGKKVKSGGDVSGGKGESRKRKVSGEGGRGTLDLGKKGKSSGDASGETGDSRRRKASGGGGGKFDLGKKGKSGGNVSDASERFSIREAEKLTFLGAERRDAKRRCPGDVDYDPKTLYLPPAFVKSLTGGKKQWWEFKSKHMDKVLFFKMGKFYELFEMDAHIGAKELDLQYMKGDQPHCGFPEKNFMMNVEKLVQKGYRVLVVEQTETPEQLEIRRKEKGSKDKVVKREICATITKGTLTEGELLSANPDASYLMALTESCQRIANQRFERFFGVCVVDVATSRIILGQFGDDAECSSLCSLLSELRPVEIIKPAKMLTSETERVVVRHTRNPLVNELVPLLEFWDANRTVQEVQAICKHIRDNSDSGSLHKADLDAIELHAGEDEPSYLPSIVSELVNRGDDGSLALSALGGTLYYLKQAFLDETLLRFAKFDFLPSSNFCEVATEPYMILDAAALENLEIFENSSNGDSSGTLYTQLNHCVTAFGKRLLKTWLARPLYCLGSIKDRQDAVAGLRGVNKPMMLEFRKALSKLPDMERLLARVCSCSEANRRNANKVVIYEDAAKKQLQEFVTALFGCELMSQACFSLGVILENVESGQLHHLLTAGKGLPDIFPIIKHFKDAFDWSEACDSGCIIPHEGADMEYDNACKKVREIESSLTIYLKEQWKLLGDTSITYATVGKEAYLLEVPEHLRGSIPRDYELHSSKKCFYRYWTPSVKELLGELAKAESEKDTALKSILQRLIVHFCEYHGKWRQLVSVTAELDVLTSLAIACDFYGPTCRPTIIGASFPSEVPHLSAKSLGHPVLSGDTSGKGAFVPNDISIGGSGCASFILLTGPNMGGKSTILRQVCLAVILAQVGADVPAESFELSPVDRIFVRTGAKDHIMAGQSTFLTELSETALMLKSATRNSLVALDELGRGTSTSDGQAISESVLEYFVRKVQCRGIFSTHYHRLAVDYQKDSKVSLCHMACQVGNGIGGLEEVTFLYRLTAGACPKSYGVNVARLAGLPDSILQNAAAKSRQFEAIYGRHKKESEENLAVQNCDEIGQFIRTFIKKTKQLSCRQPAGSIDVRLLSKLRDKARRLLQQNLSD